MIGGVENGIDSKRIGLITGREGEVGIASGLIEYLKFVIDSAEMTAAGVIEGPIAMNEGVSFGPIACSEYAETGIFLYTSDECGLQIARIVGLALPVVQVQLDFSVALLTKAYKVAQIAKAMIVRRKKPGSGWMTTFAVAMSHRQPWVLHQKSPHPSLFQFRTVQSMTRLIMIDHAKKDVDGLGGSPQQRTQNGRYPLCKGEAHDFQIIDVEPFHSGNPG